MSIKVSARRDNLGVAAMAAGEFDDVAEIEFGEHARKGLAFAPENERPALGVGIVGAIRPGCAHFLDGRAQRSVG
jgi:hypothetical protein